MLQKKIAQALVALFMLVGATGYGQVTLTGTTKIDGGKTGCYSATTTCTTPPVGVCWTTSGTIGPYNCGGGGPAAMPAGVPLAASATASAAKSTAAPTSSPVGKGLTPQNVPPTGSCNQPNFISIAWPTVTVLQGQTVRAADNCGRFATMSVTLVPPIANNITITPSAENVACGSSPGVLTCSQPTGGDNNYSYVWQSSNTGVSDDWITVSTTSGRTYQPAVNPAIYYRVIVSSFDYSVVSNTATLTIVGPPFGPGTISNTAQTIIKGTAAATINCSPATGIVCSGSPSYTSLWKVSLDGQLFASSGVTTQNLSPGILSNDTWYYRQDTYVQHIGTQTLVTVVNSNVAKVTTIPPLAAGQIGTSSYGVNIGTTGYISDAQHPSGGICGGYTYVWWQSSDGLNFTQIGGAGNADYTTPPLSAPMWYRRDVTCGNTLSSNVVEVTVHPPLIPGTLTPGYVTIASGTSPGVLTASAAQGGGCSGNYGYDWQWSQDNADWHSSGVTTLNYNPGPLYVNTWIRRVVNCGPESPSTNICLVTIGTPGGTTPSYLRTREILKPGVDILSAAAGLTSPNDVHQTTQYFDGMGKPIEVVQMKASPAQNDIVGFNIYDGLWREAVQYKDYTSPTADGNYKATPLTEQQNFFNAQFPNEQNFFYGRVNYEASPLGKITASYSPGLSWVGSNRGVTSQFLGDSALDGVINWTIASAPGSIPVNAGVYGDGKLAVLVTTDENGKAIVSYTDLNGQVVLKKVQIADNATIGHTGWKCTYYVYDDMHRIRFEITAMALQQYLGGTSLAAVADALCFRYEYDARGRMMIKKSPGQAESWMVYDAADRTVLTQDGHQRQSNQWMYSKYDKWNRVVVTGLYTDNTNTSQAAMQAALNSQNLGLYETYNNASYPEYSLTNTFPVITDPNTVLTYTYYDDYSWSGWYGAAYGAKNNGFDGQFAAVNNSTYPYPQGLQQSKMTLGKVTGVWAHVGSVPGLGTVTSTFFDDHGRTLQTVRYNISGGVDYITNQFGFTGRVLQSVEQQQKAGTNPQTHTVNTQLTYDHEGRLLTTSRSLSSVINGQPVSRPMQLIFTNAYDEAGELKTRTLGGSLETQTFDYTVRGWLKGVNRDYVNGGGAGKHFGFELAYDDATGASGASFGHSNYTGNIGGIVWKSIGDGVARKFDFSYDNLNQLAGASFQQNPGGSTGSWDANTLDFSVSGLSYDINGNLGQLSQKGWKQGVVTTIDNLQYNYPNNTIGNISNQLQNVVDWANDANSLLGDFHYANTGKTATATDFLYDPAGNLVTDNNKGLTLSYDYENMPLHVAIGSKGTIDYLYDAGGSKIKKIVTDNSVAGKTVTTTTTYIGGMEYSSRQTSPADPNNPDYTDVPQQMTTTEGRVRFVNTDGFTVTGTAGDYFLRDNLGNVRMVLTDEQQVDIYPAATLEGTGQSTDPIAVEANYYSINSGQVVTNSAATGISAYPNNNGVNNNNPNCSNTSVIKQTDLSQKIYRMNEASTAKTGLGFTLKVMSGDRLDIYGKSFYNQLNAGGQPVNVSMAATDIISGLLGAPNSPAAGHIAGSTMSGNTNGVVSPLNGFISAHDNTGAESTPRAYINYVFFDEQFNFAGSGTSQVGGANAVKDHSTDASMQGIAVPKNGYVYVFVSNESPVDVYFDNLQVVLTHGRLLEETHYYPTGLAIAAISSKSFNKPTNRYKYQGKELNNMELADGSGLDLYDFGSRNYDVQLARWTNPDPANQYGSPYMAMGNNWANKKDPNGQWALVDDLVAGVVGGLVNLGSQLLSGQVTSFGQALGYFGSGFAGGVAFEYGGPVAAGAVTGFGNALVGGKSLGEAFQQAAVGALSSIVAGPLNQAIGPVVGSFTRGLGPTISRIANNLIVNGISGGLIGGGLNAMQGGSFSQGFNQGFITGFSGAAVSMGVSTAVDAVRASRNSGGGGGGDEGGNPDQGGNQYKGDPSDGAPLPKRADPNSVPLAKTTEDESPNDNPWPDHPPRQPEWLIPGNSPRGFAIENITVSKFYSDWEHTPVKAVVDVYDANSGTAVQIKSTINPNLNLTKAINRLADLDLPAGTIRVMHVVTPPDLIIRNWNQIVIQCNQAGIIPYLTHH